MQKHVTVSSIPPLATNVLDIADADIYQCRVKTYIQGHSNMVISIHEPDSNLPTRFHLVLDSVRYFDGPMWWTGINISKGTVREYLELYARAHGQEQWSPAEIDEMVYEVEKDFAGELLLIHARHTTIKIIASWMNFTDEPLPPFYSGTSS